MKNHNKVVNLKDYELVLSYSFGNRERPCTGHIFECIEYFHILKKHFKCCILIGDCVDFESIIGHILKKYTFEENDIWDIIEAVHIADNPRIVIGDKLLLVDGNYKRLSNKVIKFNKYYAFPCGLKNECDYPDNVHILGDSRIYDFKRPNFTHYTKKILTSKLCTDVPEVKYDYMLYITEGVREIPLEEIERIVDKYDGSFVIYSDYLSRIDRSNVVVESVPVPDVFKFDTYIYTSIDRKFDCSPRFIVECELLGKNVIYELSYPMIEDKGLYYRNIDINNNEFSLDEEEQLLKVINE